MDDRSKRRPNGTGRLGGAGKPNQPNGQNPRPMRALPDADPQDSAFMVRLDPSSQPGEFNFVIDSPQEVTRKVPQSGITAEASGGIPPQLHPAVNDILGFIYELDQAFERKGKKR
jgi:hypothetical protein